jgi:hypothetical protein
MSSVERDSIYSRVKLRRQVREPPSHTQKSGIKQLMSAVDMTKVGYDNDLFIVLIS